MITRRQVLVVAGLATAAVATAACAEAGPVEDLVSDEALLSLPLDTAGVDVAARATADMAWTLLATDTEPNRVIAPSTLAVTMSMVAEGASGDTLAGIEDALGLSGPDRSEAVGALRQSLVSYDIGPEGVDLDPPPRPPVVHQASQVAIIDDAPVKEAFLDDLAGYYDAGAQRVPRGEAERMLDDWANIHTAGLIEESGITLTPSTRLVLQDAILFAAAWRTPFTSDTGTIDFTGQDGATSAVPALSGDFTVPHAAGDGWEAVRLPYDDALAMDVVLAAGSAPSQLTAQQLDDVRVALDSADPAAVNLRMPAVDLAHRWDLLAALGAQGLTFEELDGMFDGAVVEQFVQQVRLTVSAEGTVGAAVTEVSVGESAVAVDLEMVVDRPFIMRVLDTRTGWPLFLAVVSDAALMEVAP